MVRRSVHAVILLIGFSASSLLSAQDASSVRGGTGWVHTRSGLAYKNVAPGGRRLLIVPPALSRRTSYPANTPRGSVLRIDVTLMAVREK